MAKTHFGQHDDSCFACRIQSVSFAASAMVTRSSASEQKKYEQQRERDIPAYKRLRAEGLQPHRSHDAAKMEQHATSQFEIESGQYLPTPKIAAKHDRVQAEYKEAEAVARKMGVKV